MAGYEALTAAVKEARTQFLHAVSAGERNGTEVIDREILLPEWQKDGVSGDGEHPAGECCTHAGQAWKCVQEHNTNNNPDIEPGTSPAHWVPSHTKDPAKAKPFIQPTMAEDSYYPGECCVFEGSTYRSVMEGANSYSPADYPQGWEKV